MTKIRIEKFIAGQKESSFHVHPFILRLAKRVLPRAALNALAHKGIHVHTILAAHYRGETYRTNIHVCERGILKKIVISVC